jgi:hypothetical protein
MGDRSYVHQKSPLKAIRDFCMECMMWDPEEVGRCTAPNCPLYHFRHGKNPYHTRRTTPAQREAAAARLAAWRAKQAVSPVDGC